MGRPRALGPGRELVTEPDVGERAAHHHFVVPATGTVGIELAGRDAAFLQVAPRGRIRFDRARRGDVIGRDRIADAHEDPRSLDILDRSRLLLEERRFLHVGRRGVPGVHRSARSRQRHPPFVAVPDVGVLTLELVLRDRRGHRGGDLVGRRPDVSEEDGSVGAHAERFARHIHLDRTGQGVRHAERRRGQVARPHLRVDPALEVPVAGEHRHDVEIALVHRRGDALGQRPGVPDARRAAVPDEREPELLEIGSQTRAVEVVGDDARARCQ